MNKRWGRELCRIFLAVTGVGLLLFGCGDGGGGSDPATPPAALEQGIVVSTGPVAEAMVFADKNGNNAWDEDQGEAVTYSNDDGTYTLTVPYGNYRLVSDEGIDTLTGGPALPMIAAAGSRSISPLTTLVQLAGDRTALQLVLDEHSGGTGFNVDLSAAEGVPTDLLKLSLNLAQVLRVLEDLGISDRDLQERVMKLVADQLVETAKTQPDINLLCKEALTAGMVAAVREMSADNSVEFEVAPADEGVFESNVAAMVDGINAALDGSLAATPTLQGSAVATMAAKNNAPTLVVDQPLVAVVNAAASSNKNSEALKKACKTVTLGCRIDEYTGTFKTIFSGTEKAVTIKKTAEAVRFVLLADNDFNWPIAYDKANLQISVREVKAKGKDKGHGSMEMDLDGVLLVVGPGLNNVSLNTDKAKFSVKLTLSDKTKVKTTPSYGPFEVLALTGNSVTLNVAKIRSLLDQNVFGQNLAGADLVGNYDVVVKVKQAPAPSVSFGLQVL